MRPTVFLLLIFNLLVSIPSHAAVVAQSGPQEVSLIEVYSSEGCSSCPPAESWVSQLIKNPGVWNNFVPVVFHVDYWDSLGWKDPLSEAKFSERQRNYAAIWKSESAYTPGFVLNGHEWRNWYAQDLNKLSGEKEAGLLQIDQIDANHFTVNFDPTTKYGASAVLSVNAALLGFAIQSDVKAGENEGKHLRHDFAVLDYTKSVLRLTGDGRWTQTIELTPGSVSSAKTGVAVWVTEAESVEPIQAAGTFLT